MGSRSNDSIDEENKSKNELPSELVEYKAEDPDENIIIKTVKQIPSFFDKISGLSYKASTLVTTLMMAKKNPTATAMAIVSMAPEILRFIGVNEASTRSQGRLRHLLEEYNAVCEDFNLLEEGPSLEVLFNIGVAQRFERTIRYKPFPDENDGLINLKINDEVVLVYIGSFDGARCEGNYIWVNKKYTLTQVISRMLESFLHVPCAELSVKKGEAILRPVLFNGVYVGKNDPVKFADKMEKLRRKNIDRSAIFYGPPGTGKTTFVLSYSELTRKRVLIIGPDIIANGIEVGLYIEVLKPDILLLDDYDRTGDYNFAYSTLPAIKSRNPNMQVIITCNNPRRLGSAILRPGRGGTLLEFGPPSVEDKILIFKQYLEFYNIPNAELLSQNASAIISKLSDEWTHDWVRELAKSCTLYNYTTSELEAIHTAKAAKTAKKRTKTTEQAEEPVEKPKRTSANHAIPKELLEYIETTNKQFLWIGVPEEDEE